MIRGSELVAGFDVVMEDATEVDDTGDDGNIVVGGGGENQGTWPWFEGVEDDHGPIDQGAEAVETQEHVEGEPVGGAWRHAQLADQAGLTQAVQSVPDGILAVADGIGVMEEEDVEPVGPASFERFFRGHAEVICEVLGAAEARVGESGEPFGAVAFSGVEVMTDGADEAIGVAWEFGEGPAKEFVGITIAGAAAAEGQKVPRGTTVDLTFLS